VDYSILPASVTSKAQAEMFAKLIGERNALRREVKSKKNLFAYKFFTLFVRYIVEVLFP
jgi:hypothetical protein